jgi:hypothetical protein
LADIRKLQTASGNVPAGYAPVIQALAAGIEDVMNEETR